MHSPRARGVHISCAGVGVCVHQTVRGLACFCDHRFGLSRSGEGKSQRRGVCVSGECDWGRACLCVESVILFTNSTSGREELAVCLYLVGCPTYKVIKQLPCAPCRS